MSGAAVLPLAIIMYLALVVSAVWLIVKLLMGVGWAIGSLFRGIGFIVGRTIRFTRDEIVDTMSGVGGAITSVFFLPLILLNIIVGRWSTANHYGRALEREVLRVGRSAYRVAIGNPARLFGLHGLTEGIEHRVPEAIAQAPSTRGRSSHFDGYRVTGTLQAGGSGAKLYLADPSKGKLREFAAQGLMTPSKVVIKSFSLDQGSTLPQIVRESRALEAAKSMGMVLDHDMNPSRFYYAMPYVPGEDLGIVGGKLHGRSGTAGLSDQSLNEALGYASDLLETLDRFHTGGLWHKDIKPNNVIVSAGRAHLVDFGLTTPLQSALTLTTHGTEYFRDPEMVRLALKGVKVHEVDGVKFDIYGVGALLFSLLENSFPAHGSLSQITKRCPDTLRWIVRRAMADMQNRYGSAREMLADLETVLAASDPFKVKPAELPSMRGGVKASTINRIERAIPFAGAPSPWPIPDAPSDDVSARRVAASAALTTATPRNRTGVRWGVLAAVVMLTASAAGFFGMLFVGGTRMVSNTSSTASAPVPPAPRPASEASIGWITTQSDDLVTAPRAPANAGPILVLTDLGDAGHESVASMIVNALDEVGYDVVCESSECGDRTPCQLTLLSSAEYVIRQRPLSASLDENSSLGDDLARFLDGSEAEDLHAILLLSSDGKSLDKHLITRSSRDTQALMPVLSSSAKHRGSKSYAQTVKRTL